MCFPSPRSHCGDSICQRLHQVHQPYHIRCKDHIQVCVPGDGGMRSLFCYVYSNLQKNQFTSCITIFLVILVICVLRISIFSRVCYNRQRVQNISRVEITNIYQNPNLKQTRENCDTSKRLKAGTDWRHGFCNMVNLRYLPNNICSFLAVQYILPFIAKTESTKVSNQVWPKHV